MRVVGRTIVWLFIGLLGSALILLGADTVIDAKSLPRIVAGTSVSTEFWDNLTLKDGSVVSEQLRQEVRSNILPFAWAAFCFWWAFLIFKIVVRARKDALPHKAMG
jgi:drug/metabolite transporter (DMT)-like permease